MSRVDISPFGKTNSDTPCSLYTLENSHGTKLQVTDLGATMVSFYCRDKDGELDNILLRHKDAASYQSKGGFLGALVGPYANRIGGAQFSIDGKSYSLTANQASSTLHGADACFAYRHWQCVTCELVEGVPTLVLSLDFKDGTAGFPGNAKIKVHFSLHEDNCLRVHMVAETDRKAAISLTQHPYFNLAGEAKSTQELIGQHQFQIFSNAILDVDELLVPTGEQKTVADSIFDFSKMKGVMDVLHPLHQDLAIPCGFDHNYCFEPWSASAPSLTHQAAARDLKSGRRLDVYSSLPGLQFYTGNHLLEAQFERFEGFCFEPQYYPDSPNKAHFPFAWTEPGKPFSHTIEWRVGIDS